MYFIMGLVIRALNACLLVHIYKFKPNILKHHRDGGLSDTLKCAAFPFIIQPCKTWFPEMHTGALSAPHCSRQYNSSACVLKQDVIPD